MIFDLETIGDPDDGMVSVYTGCIDGNGKRQIAVISLDNSVLTALPDGVNLYDNGEPVSRGRMQDESWYGWYQELIELSMATQFRFKPIPNPGVLIRMYHEQNVEAPTQEQLLRWSVFLTERHNNTYNCPTMVKAYEHDYSELKTLLKDWTDWDETVFRLAVVEKKMGAKDFFKQVAPDEGLAGNKHWIYTNNPLSDYIGETLQGLVKFALLEENGACLYRWRNE